MSSRERIQYRPANGPNDFDATAVVIKYNEISKYEPKLVVWGYISECISNNILEKWSGNRRESFRLKTFPSIPILERGLVPFSNKYHSDLSSNRLNNTSDDKSPASQAELSSAEISKAG